MADLKLPTADETHAMPSLTTAERLLQSASGLTGTAKTLFRLLFIEGNSEQVAQAKLDLTPEQFALELQKLLRSLMFTSQ
ncbi:MAG: hypothetical protein V4731_03970 [Pseudomonadota bacterium]